MTVHTSSSETWPKRHIVCFILTVRVSDRALMLTLTSPSDLCVHKVHTNNSVSTFRPQNPTGVHLYSLGSKVTALLNHNSPCKDQEQINISL